MHQLQVRQPLPVLEITQLVQQLHGVYMLRMLVQVMYLCLDP